MGKPHDDETSRAWFGSLLLLGCKDSGGAEPGHRNAKYEQGRPLYTTRDWAAWVLTGEPD